MITLRAWQDSDSVGELTELLHRAYARWADRGLHFVAIDQTEERTRHRLKDAHTFVAEREGKLVGTISLYPNSGEHNPELYSESDIWYFGQFAVSPDLSGTGLGRQLLEHGEQFAHENGATRMACDTQFGADELVEYYERRGYRRVGQHQWSSGDLSHVFLKDLA